MARPHEGRTQDGRNTCASARMTGAGARRHAAAIRQSWRLQISGYPAPKPSRPQLSFRGASPTVVSV
ncbi:hypothetical protein DIE08_04910 [Burkholderia sp. Bp9004]|nr:hypothetical protein DIE08_04910 [Burkholderia sp. Bp9004]